MAEERKESPENTIVDITSQCKVIVYSWNKRELAIDSNDLAGLAATTMLDVSSRILNLSFTKSMESPSGNFVFSLANNTGLIQDSDPNLSAIIRREDWKDIIKPGSWCLIYLSNYGELEITDKVALTAGSTRLNPENLRCIGYIERVAVKGNTGSEGIIFEVSGRDFGVVYEETVMWHDLFNYSRSLLEAVSGTLKVTGNLTLDQVLENVHNLLFNPSAVSKQLTNENGSLNEISRQWLLPSALLRDLQVSTGIGAPSYYGNIRNLLDFSPSNAIISVTNPVSSLSGEAWAQLKQLSVPELHELFTETDLDGQPKLIFRPIPWGIDNSGYPKLRENITLYKDVERIEMSASDLLFFDLGEDDHNRKNHFLTTTTTSVMSSNDNIVFLKGKKSSKGNEFPLQFKESVTRHGFRPLHIQVNTLTANELLADGKPDASLLVQYNELMKDYWMNTVHFESGTVSIIGNNNIKLGKVLMFDSETDYIGEKLYYIEEYTDEFIVQENGSCMWTQTVKLTHGAELSDLEEKSGFGQRAKVYTEGGDFV